MVDEPLSIDRIPKMGMFIPIMGKTKERGLASALFTPVQQRVLGLLYGQPERRFQTAELIRLARSGSGAVQRQLERLEATGLVSSTKIANLKFYQANAETPVFTELSGLIAKTVGIAEPLRRVLQPLAKEIRAAFVYGSVAKKSDRAASDIDLLVISDSLTHQKVFQALSRAEETLARPVNPTLVTTAEWRSKRSAANSFMAKIASGEKMMVIGDVRDVD